MTRELLPARRHNVTIEFEHAMFGANPWPYKATVGYYDVERTRPGEVFIDTGKTGTQTETWARDGAILMSLALQHGCRLETIRGALTKNQDGSPCGPIGTLAEILAGPHEV